MSFSRWTGRYSRDSKERAIRLVINAEAAVKEALVCIGCRDEWYMIAESVCRRKRSKEKLDGKPVEKTTGLQETIRDNLAAVKQMASEDELISIELEEIRGLIQETVADLR